MRTRVVLVLGFLALVIAVASASGIILADRMSTKPHLAPVTPITALPGPNIPQLTNEEIARAKELLAADARIAVLFGDSGYVIERTGPWLWSENSTKRGAFMRVTLTTPVDVEGAWPYVVDQSDGSYTEVTWRKRVLGLRTVYVSVDLRNDRVAEIDPVEYIDSTPLEAPPW